VARRLQRPLTDRAPHGESRHADEHADIDGDEHVADTLAWYARAIEIDGESVIAAPTGLLDQIDPPTRPEAVGTILLEDTTESRDIIPKGNCRNLLGPP
jgi:hypothetical protein